MSVFLIQEVGERGQFPGLEQRIDNVEESAAEAVTPAEYSPLLGQGQRERITSHNVLNVLEALDWHGDLGGEVLHAQSEPVPGGEYRVIEQSPAFTVGAPGEDVAGCVEGQVMIVASADLPDLHVVLVEPLDLGRLFDDLGHVADLSAGIEAHPIHRAALWVYA